ncbi:hypothetical protein GCM10009634_51730 [Saccharothrix xinjiangensis]
MIGTTSSASSGQGGSPPPSSSSPGSAAANGSSTTRDATTIIAWPAANTANISSPARPPRAVGVAGGDGSFSATVTTVDNPDRRPGATRSDDEDRGGSRNTPGNTFGDTVDGTCLPVV